LTLSYQFPSDSGVNIGTGRMAGTPCLEVQSRLFLASRVLLSPQLQQQQWHFFAKWQLSISFNARLPKKTSQVYLQLPFVGDVFRLLPLRSGGLYNLELETLG
jgi:hypothetical protein